MKKITALCFFVLALILVLVTSCGDGEQEYIGQFHHKSGLYFKFPPGWSTLSKSEWRELKMGNNQTLISIMDEKRLAGFSLIPLSMNQTVVNTTRLLGDELEARIVVLLESINKAGPSRYNNYKLVRKGAAEFASLPVGELVFQGQNPGKLLRWYRVLIVGVREKMDQIIMFVFTAPLGQEGEFELDFSDIEDSLSWKK